MTTVRLHYWAGARAAAGREYEEWTADSIDEALAAARARRDARFTGILSVCSLLLDGVVVDAARSSQRLEASVTVEILPPFAGGSTN